MRASTGKLGWFKSSYSAGNGGDCVEVACTGSAVLIRDSKRPEEAQFSVGAEEWAVFVRMAVCG
ncbi:DUF397 domain-containing protein [Streptomyces sp. NPDC023723]|uniref:DUF397 domain-containing protein n=1 Tax=Streptomyces sp. NPDC023723 TaxID=3154323 RepID=UPI0033FAE8A5